MPILYKIDSARQRVFTTVTGIITAIDIIGHFEVARTRRFLPYAEFIDTSSITQSDAFPVGEIGKSGDDRAEVPPAGKFGARAVVVANDTIFGLTRIFTHFDDPPTFRWKFFATRSRQKHGSDGRHNAEKIKRKTKRRANCQS